MRFQQVIHSMHKVAAAAGRGRSGEGLAHDSEQITSILTVIQGIADQTNLLALNAAIEAAGPASRARFACGGRRGAQAGRQHPAGGAEYPGADRQDPPQLTNAVNAIQQSQQLTHQAVGKRIWRRRPSAASSRPSPPSAT